MRQVCLVISINFEMFVALSCLCILLVPFARGIVLSSSELKTCVRDGYQASLNLTCLKKLVLTVAVGSGQDVSTDSLEFSLSCIGSPNGVCPCPCNYASDPSCNCRDFQAPLTITVTKTPVWASYPLQYLQSFNYKPYEAVVRPNSGKCSDHDLDPRPTCGWYTVGTYKVPDSQGFVCQCDLVQIWDTTLGIGNQQRTRANLDCDFFSDPLNILIGNYPCSAHCLMFSPLWYSGYQLGPPSLQFEISVTLTVPIVGGLESGSDSMILNHKTYEEYLTLSPSVPLAVSSSGLAGVQLLGDLATYTSLPSLDGQVLLIPQPDGWTIDQILAENRTEWLLLDQSHIDMDDNSCNKVGTAFSAFRNQNNACARAPQTCLGNQIKDLKESDLARVSIGKVPLYMVTQYTYGSNSLMRSFKGGPLSFALPVASQSSSLIVINVVADNVSLITNASPGVINGARICTFSEINCGGFEAGASRGYLFINISNTGYISATYTLTVSNCSLNIRPVEARTLALAPGVPLTIEPPIQIFVEDSSSDPGRYCWLTLYDSIGTVTDKRQVSFFTNATIYTPIPNGGLNNSGDGVGGGDSSECHLMCGTFWNLICFVKFRCWSLFGRTLGVIGGIVAAVGLAFLLIKMGFLVACLSSCSACLGCCSGSGKNGNRESLGHEHEIPPRQKKSPKQTGSDRQSRELHYYFPGPKGISPPHTAPVTASTTSNNWYRPDSKGDLGDDSSSGSGMHQSAWPQGIACYTSPQFLSGNKEAQITASSQMRGQFSQRQQGNPFSTNPLFH